MSRVAGDALQWTEGTCLRLGSGGRVEIRMGARTIVTDERALQLLESFARPTAMKDVIERLRAASAEDFVEASRLLLQLRDQGVIADASGDQPRRLRGFDAPAAHVSMLADRARTLAFLRAVEAAVKPGDVVVEVGTGTGVLAIAAARAGARRVYAIEQGSIADAAEAMIAANGVADRVRIVRARSTRVELPERGHVLVSETLGHDPLAEGVVPIFRDALRRLLVPDARVVPIEVSLYGLPVDLPDAFVGTCCFTESNTRAWSHAYGIDFAPLQAYSQRTPDLANTSADMARTWKTLADPVLLERVSLAGPEATPEPKRVSFVARDDAARPGLVVYFDAALAPGVAISTSPRADAPVSNWTCRVFRACRTGVRAGDEVSFDFDLSTYESVVRIA